MSDRVTSSGGSRGLRLVAGHLPCHIADALIYCDLATFADAAPITVANRLADVIARYGADGPSGERFGRPRHELFAWLREVEPGCGRSSFQSDFDPMADLELGEPA
jgi:hypothetical protein